MKNIINIALAIIIALSFAGNLKAAEGSKAIALVMKVEGKAELTRDGQKSKLKFGTVLHNDDIVQTFSKGYVSLIFTDDKSIIKLTENTKVTVQGERGDDGNIKKRMSMEIGNLYAKVKQQRGTLEIATPTSVASVKGTEFWIVVDGDGKSHLITIGGLVSFLNKFNGQVVDVRPGEKVELDENNNLIISKIPLDEIPPEPDKDEEGEDDETDAEPIIKNLGIDFGNYDGDVRTIRIQLQEPAPKKNDNNGGDE